MARLHEYQGKAILKRFGIDVPAGTVARSPEEARAATEKIGGRVILKVQAWTTSRKARGGVVLADSPDQAAKAARNLLAMKFGNFPVSDILVEDCLDIAQEIFVSLSIDDAAKAPVLLIDFAGGSGIEERAERVSRLPIDVRGGIDQARLRSLLAASPLERSTHGAALNAISALFNIAKSCEARSVEINPLVTTRDGRVVAADCRITIDDYAVFRHPELGIEIARELDHPPTELERIAYAIEQADHRGTFYFAQLPFDAAAAAGRLIGFHGAGGGGSMMSMDAVTGAGFVPANFCDTSGNPSAAKVYRAARIILAQPGLVGYFGSGSGVASQEQFWSAYGLAKAFIEMNMSIPAVIRLGGNSEDRAVEILHDACRGLPAPIEGYRKDDTPGFCAARFRELVEQQRGKPAMMKRRVPDFVGANTAASFPINGGRVWLDPRMDKAGAELVLKHGGAFFRLDESGKPTLAVSEADIANKDSEMILLEIECRRAIRGRPVVFVDLPIFGIDPPSRV